MENFNLAMHLSEVTFFHAMPYTYKPVAHIHGCTKKKSTFDKAEFIHYFLTLFNDIFLMHMIT